MNWMIHRLKSFVFLRGLEMTLVVIWCYVNKTELNGTVEDKKKIRKIRAPLSLKRVDIYSRRKTRSMCLNNHLLPIT